MYKTISYLEIRCNYNLTDLSLFAGSCIENGSRRVISYRGRRYYFFYDSSCRAFILSNARCVPFAYLYDNTFRYHPPRVPEIGLELVWGLLAKINVYPVNCL